MFGLCDSLELTWFFGSISSQSTVELLRWITWIKPEALCWFSAHVKSYENCYLLLMVTC